MKNSKILTIQTSSNLSHPAAFIDPFRFAGTLLREA